MTSKSTIIKQTDSVSNEAEQLSLGLKVSSLEALYVRIKKYLRSLSLSPFIVVLKLVTFWINAGLLMGISYVIYASSEIIKNGRGVLVLSGYGSGIEIFKQNSVLELNVIYYYIFFMILVFVATFWMSAVMVNRGKTGLAQYLLLFETVLFLICIKLILFPLIIVGG